MLGNMYFNGPDDCNNNLPLVNVNCTSDGVNLPCIIKLPTECSIYNGPNYPAYGIAKNQDLNTVLTQVITNLGGDSLTEVHTENTSSIIFSGTGTTSSPLTAIYTGPTTASTLQQVNAAGNTTSIPMLITGNASTSVAGLYLGKNYVRSRGTGSTFDSLQIDGEDVQIVGNLIVLLQTAGGQIIVPQTGSKMTLNSAAGINFTSTGIVPAQFNTRVKGLDGTEADDFATVAQLGATGEPLWVGSFNEQVISTAGVINNLAITSNLLRFTGTGVVLTGIATQTARAKTIVLINNTGVDINLQHLSSSSTANNQLFILGQGLTAGSNVTLGNNSAVTFVYSNSKWRITDWFGDGYHPNLVGTGTRVIEVLPSGKEQATESFDYEYFRTDLTAAQSDADLNTLYPGAFRGTSVICKNITGGGRIYKKDDDVLNTWVRIALI